MSGVAMPEYKPIPTTKKELEKEIEELSVMVVLITHPGPTLERMTKVHNQIGKLRSLVSNLPKDKKG